MKTFRQISLLLLLFLLAVSSTAFAADWQRIGANDKCAHFFDRDSIRYERFYPPFFGKSRPDTSRITYWEKITIAPEEAEAMAEELDDPRYLHLDYVLLLETASLHDRTITIREEIRYDRAGNILLRDLSERVSNIIPGSWGETVFNTVVDYARLHHEELLQNT